MLVQFIETAEYAVDIDADDFDEAKEIAIEMYYNGEIQTDGCYMYTQIGDREHGFTTECIDYK